jgi:hypothetical protein
MTIVLNIANVLFMPFQVVGRTLTSRIGRALSLRAIGRRQYRPKQNFTLPVIEYSQLSSLYFAIDQATNDDVVCPNGLVFGHIPARHTNEFQPQCRQR